MIRHVIAVLLATAAMAGAGMRDTLLVRHARARAAEPVAETIWTGLVEYYALDGTALDQVSNATGTWGADVVSTNAVPFAAAGSAASLNRAANAYVTAVSTNLLNGSSNMTVAAWVYLRQWNFVGGIAHYNRSGNTDNWGIRQSSAASNLIGSIRVSSVDKLTGNAPVTAGQWFHVAQTYAHGDSVRLYVNGVLSATSSVATVVIQQNRQMLIGYDNDTAARKTDGIIDEVPIWNRALTSNEVYRLYNEQLIYRRP